VRVLVTGGYGKVGRHTAAALSERGHTVVLTDIVPARYGPRPRGELPYLRADLTDYGATIGTVMKADPEVVVHAAGIPDPSHDVPATVFANNTLATFNVAEAIARTAVGRLVYLSSETVVGYVTAERPADPDYLPVDEAHPVRPQDAYALSKAVGESICDALVRRSDVSVVSIRPSLVLDADDYANIAPLFQKRPALGRVNCWSYVDVSDLAELIALAVEASTAGHEIVYAAQPDNLAGRPLSELVEIGYGANGPALRPIDRADAAGISAAKARALFGWVPTRSWRDHQ
jgi:UDP-glucose 4-epimerase